MTVTPWTYAPAATIEVGSDSFVNGTRFGCQRGITIGPTLCAKMNETVPTPEITDEGETG
jgi:hypothetical protein